MVLKRVFLVTRGLDGPFYTVQAMPMVNRCAPTLYNLFWVEAVYGGVRCTGVRVEAVYGRKKNAAGQFKHQLSW